MRTVSPCCSQRGDTVRTEIDGIGVLENRFVQGD
jgi:2-keto-4-pentenoate hydratase/2-oxohepta-3-ene-1,7-dioic acid hydratase in catechol pathway